GALHLIEALRNDLRLFVPGAQIPQLLSELFTLPRLPQVELPQEFALQEVRGRPRPRLIIARPSGSGNRLAAELMFEYAGVRMPSNPPLPAMYDASGSRLIWRDQPFEASCVDLLQALGLRRPDASAADDSWKLPSNRLGRIVATLVSEGWIVEAEGKVYRRAGRFNVRVSSGIDWLEMTGEMDFDGQLASLPELLTAARSGERLVRLDDGSYGVLPEDWLSQFGMVAALGQLDGPQVKFSRKQAGLLDALLSTIPDASWDESLTRLRSELPKFQGIAPAEAPRGFQGELRHYQQEGLGWIHFLRRLGFGGCLADDMGLGKTIQVLALLQQRREAGIKRPSLVIVPRSLIFNWLSEAQKFTPELRVLDYSGADRAIPENGFRDYDLVLSTYGTVRRDALALKDIHFDYIVLDEAQAIKNSQSESARAVRVLRSDYRLALSGTPVQNHLGELWSLFEFLNPGLLGTATAFKAITSAGIDPTGKECLARALRPFILRRTKSQVAPELPEKLEQTLFCELDRHQRKLYDELREHYRASLLQQVDELGIGKSRMQILEALLRLRQAACHPGLIDRKRVGESSAKLDALLPQLEEVIDEGHKILVFSQFTSFLSILRRRLDASGIVYEYLDGKTSDRQRRVRRFQNDPDCKLFLISLKAGGLGLNLTAAEYVFLLDPWWNPAVEQQAIDRTHRIGQTRKVFAYRLIARNTVEEKVLELQKAKRDLADAIITADNSLISSMGREELELLLS
ncbi:MAG: SNF2 family helicase, partial [Phycisphaerae bacterium]|nr:SNF2 family helicase [Phycisphaerae bacterium]